MNNPYSNLPTRSFWRTGALQTHPLSPQKLYQKSFEIDKSDKILTAGSFRRRIKWGIRAF